MPENNPQTLRNADSSNIRDIPPHKLAFLCSLIPKSFDGNRTELYEFVSNCENAFKFAHNSQNEPLIAYVISKITGSAKAQLRDKEINDWKDLKELLIQLYADKKHYTQLMEDLNTIRQNFNESILSFHNRVDKLYTRIVNCISDNDEGTRKARVQIIKELALQRFILHSQPEISRFLRSKNSNNLSDALTSALEEERALQISKSSSLGSRPSKFCKNCKTKTHNTQDCFKNKKFNVQLNKPSENSNTNNHSNTNYNSNKNYKSNGNYNSSYQSKFCNYCKKNGHLIDDCFKRQRKNEGNSSNQNINYNSNFSNNTESLNENASQNNVVSADWE